jgi:predicted 3-demethylubiquinone-9 3-methyltransferase (glyoxalase superfamily)
MTTTVTPFLWFDDQAEQAAALYISIFGGSIVRERRWGPGAPFPEGSVMSVTFELAGCEYEAFNGGPGHPFTDAFSISVTLDTQAELDDAWDRLLEGGGRPIACGWLCDRFGLSWQIVPKLMGELLSDPDPERSGRAMRAMLQMVKLDAAALQAAADGTAD